MFSFSDHGIFQDQFDKYNKARGLQSINLEYQRIIHRKYIYIFYYIKFQKRETFPIN